MFDAIMDVDIAQVECVCPIIPVQYIGHSLRYKVAKARGVVIYSGCVGCLAKGDVFTVVRKNTFESSCTEV